MRLFLLVVAAGIISAAGVQAASIGDTEQKLLPDDGAERDQFGISVGIDGTTAIVGANQNSWTGTNTGSAYLFDTTTGSQTEKLTADDGAELDFFGWSVGIDGTTAIVGAYRDDDNGSDSGSAYLFDTTTGDQLFKLTADDGAADDSFGRSVGVSGTTAIVGAYADDDDNGLNSGSAYLFDTTTGDQLFKLTADDTIPFDLFGYSVAIDGNIAIVGSRFNDGNAIDQSGSAYLFDTTTGTQIAKLTASDAAPNDYFGSSVAIDGNFAIVGASRDDDNGFNSGSVYIFDISTFMDGTTDYTETEKITAGDGATEDWFGYSVGIDGSAAIVGAYQDRDNGLLSGSAYVYGAAVPEVSATGALAAFMSVFALMALLRERRVA